MINVDTNDFVQQLAHANWILTGNKTTQHNINCLKGSFASFHYYQTLEQQIASIVLSIAKNHCFLDGNKRVALLALHLLNGQNNVGCKVPTEHLDDVLVDIASHKYTVNDVVQLLY